MSTYILIPGAWHGAWCFEIVAPLLRARGHVVLTPDLPGMGEDKTPLAQLSFELWARFTARLADSQAEPVILLGHSRGGIVITQAAEYASGSIGRLVYLTAGLPRNGETMLEAAFGPSLDPQLVKPEAVTQDGMGEVVPEGFAAARFYNQTPPELVERAISRLTPEPLFSRTARVYWTEAHFGRLPRAYIETLHDQALPIEAQRRMQAALPCETVVTMDTDHSPFYSAPEALAGHLHELRLTG